jgi:hypothetical protein
MRREDCIAVFVTSIMSTENSFKNFTETNTTQKKQKRQLLSKKRPDVNILKTENPKFAK